MKHVKDAVVNKNCKYTNDRILINNKPFVNPE